jgi:hypothetical protein
MNRISPRLIERIYARELEWVRQHLAAPEGGLD